MKKVCCLVVVVFSLVLNSLFYLRTYSQDGSLIDTYTIDITGDTLNTITALNITVSIANNATQLQPGVIFMANGASLLLSDVKASTGVVSVVWTGNITDGKLTVSGKLTPVSTAPEISVSKIEAAGGKDITAEVTSTITTSASTTQSTPTPTAVPSATPEGTPTPTPVSSGPSITISAPDEIDVSNPRQRRAIVRVAASNFARGFTRCTARTSDRTVLRISPRVFPLGQNLRNARLVARVHPFVVSSLLDDEIFEETATINISCRNGAQASKEITIFASVLEEEDSDD